jgi:plasmid stabilization system protein ParE
MVERAVILPRAARDIDEAVAWYTARDPRLGEEFLRRVDDCLLAVRRTPEAFTGVGKGYRRALLRRFPYGVFYEYVNDSVVVYAVVHCSQDPERWRARLP